MIQPRIGLGCMRLSMVDSERATAVIHAALDAGVRLLDTADVYAPDDRQLHHNERLVGRVLAGWSGDRHGVIVATKGGLTRPGGRWRPDGRAKHLQATCEASLEALGVERIGLYLLHAIDPATPLETSARALSRLVDQGLVAAIGLCNATVAQIERARQVAPIAAVQMGLGPFDETALRNGVAEYCAEHGLLLLAHTPLGGPKGAPRLGRDPVFGALGKRRGVSAAQMALAWLLDISPVAVPLPGPTQLGHVREVAEATTIALTDADRDELDAYLTAGRQLRVPRAARQPAPDAEGEVVLLMGMPGAGKSTAVEDFVAGRGSLLGGVRRAGFADRGRVVPACAGAAPMLVPEAAARARARVGGAVRPRIVGVPVRGRVGGGSDARGTAGYSASQVVGTAAWLSRGVSWVEPGTPVTPGTLGRTPAPSQPRKPAFSDG